MIFSENFFDIFQASDKAGKQSVCMTCVWQETTKAICRRLKNENAGDSQGWSKINKFNKAVFCFNSSTLKS